MEKLSRKLLVLVLAIVVSMASITGGTIAWFTDEVTSAKNVITSGNLDVELYYQPNGQTGWTKVEEGTNVFKQNALWEPGYTEVVKLKVVNVGNLAVKYVLGANVASETPSTNVMGEAFNLSDYIKAGVVAGELTGDREQVIAAVDASADFLKDGNTTALHTLATGDDEVFTMAVYMPTTVGNEANHAKDAAAPVINLGLKLLATQQTAETDSFDNQYDAGASLWNGDYPGSQPSGITVDTTAKRISINDAQGFAYLNTLVNDPDFYEKYGSKWQYSIELNCNIDLLNEPWTPINLSNFVEFNGNGHTIRNLNVAAGDEAGLFGAVTCNDIGATYIRNFTLEGATVKGHNSVGAVIGNAKQGVVENVNVINANVTGNKYVGGIFGWGGGAVNNCSVKNSNIMIPVDGDKEAGGLIGYLSNDGKESNVNKIISGNVVENVTVVAPTIASGLVSQPNSSNKGGAVIVIENNTLKNVKVLTADNTAAVEVSNNVGGKSKVQNNTATDCTTGKGTSAYGMVLETADETGTIHVNDKEGFLNLSKLSADWRKLFSDGKGTKYINYANGAGATYYYSNHWTISLDTDIDLGNQPIEPVVIMFGEGTGATKFNGNNHVIRNINTTTGLFADGTRASYANLVLENVKATKGALTGVSNSSISNVTVKNATISGADYVGGLTGRLFSNVTGCTVIDSTVTASGKEAGGLIGYAETNSITTSIANNTVKNVSVTANNRAAGLVGQVNLNVKVYNNTVDTVIVEAADKTNYQPGAVVSNALDSTNVYGNTAVNVTIK